MKKLKTHSSKRDLDALGLISNKKKRKLENNRVQRKLSLNIEKFGNFSQINFSAEESRPGKLKKKRMG